MLRFAAGLRVAVFRLAGFLTATRLAFGFVRTLDVFAGLRAGLRRGAARFLPRFDDVRAIDAPDHRFFCLFSRRCILRKRGWFAKDQRAAQSR